MNLSRFTPMMLAAMEVETRAYPSMKPYLENLLSKPNADEVVHVEIRKALINELDPSRYPKLAGRWILLRKSFRKELEKQGGPVDGLGAAAAGGGTAAVVGAVAELAHTRAMFQARMAARAGGTPVSVGQVTQMAKEEAKVITNNAISNMAKDEVRNQVRLDTQLTAKEKVNPMVYAAPAAAVAALALR